MKLFGAMEVTNNSLYIGDISTVSLAREYGTPLQVFDEKLIRSNCRRYYNAFVKKGENRVAYAGKAFLSVAICQLVKEENMYLDVVSGGELYTAYKSEFPMEKVYFHGNNKTYDEIEMGIQMGVGRFVVDNFYEIEIINKLAIEKKKKVKILFRVSPGIEAHTHEYIKTGQIDSKFGFTIVNGKLYEAVEKVKGLKGIELVGLHCHIGSQIFDIKPYEDEVDIMLEILNEINRRFDLTLEELDLGGGFGIYYNKGDDPKEIEEVCTAILNRADEKCKKLGIKCPLLTIEPGRSIVGNAGLTLYTVGSIKDIPSIRKYVAVDGGMTDNIRPALYKAQYECVIANKVNNDNTEVVTIAGKCCESGDILLNDVEIPEVKHGDLLAVLSTGAYGYSMSSNYNKIAKPAVVMVKDNNVKMICRRQSYEEMISCELSL